MEVLRALEGRKMQPMTQAMVPTSPYTIAPAPAERLDDFNDSAGTLPICESSLEQQFHDELREQVGPRNFNHWFDRKITLRFLDEELVVGVASPFLLNWLQQYFRSDLSAAAARVLGKSLPLRFVVDPRVALPAIAEHGAGVPGRMVPSVAAEIAEKSIQRQDAAPPAPKQGMPPIATTPIGTTPTASRRLAALSDFVRGSSNEMALTAAWQVCESPGGRYNPVFVHGNVGTGKTHLLEGICRQLKRQYPSLNILLLTAEAFVNHFSQALREHSSPSFRQRFRNVDVLLVDDIDFFSGKRVMQEEFLHTIKQLHSHGRQIVLTADKHPRLQEKLSEELTTRFLSGLVCRIEAPDLETRQRIVAQKAKQFEAEIAPEALDFVAQRFRNNVRELEGALNCLDTLYRMTQRRVSLTAARNILSDLERDCIRIVRMTDVEQKVCELFGVNAADLRSPRRHRSISQPRMLAMYLSRKLTQAAYAEIGEHFGGRNHSTVMSAERKVLAMLDRGEAISAAARKWPLKELLDSLEQQLQAG